MICAAEGLKKICREYPSFSLCAECSLGLLQLFLALGNQNSWNFFFPETGVVFGHLECLDVYIFFLGKLLFIQRVLGPGNHYHRRELRVHPGWVLRVPWKKHFSGACWSCSSSPVTSSHLVLVWAGTLRQMSFHLTPFLSVWLHVGSQSCSLVAAPCRAHDGRAEVTEVCEGMWQRNVTVPPALLTLSHCWELPVQHCSVQPNSFPGCHNHVPLIGDLSSTFLK